jgi:Leucine rich repeat variant
MSDWLDELVSENLISVFEGRWCTEDAAMWLREQPRTLRELRAEEIDWLRWMAANIEYCNVLKNLSEDGDSEVRMWVACNPNTPARVLRKLAEDPVVCVRRGVAQNKNTPLPVLTALSRDRDVVVRSLTLKNHSG